MRRIFYVDVPNPHTIDDDDSWVNIAVVHTRKRAEEILMKKYGIKPWDTNVFITEGGV